MFRKTLKAAAMALALMIAMVSLASCMGVANSSVSTETEAPAPEIVKPADAGKVDLTKADPSTDDVKFTFDEEGRVLSIEYKKGDLLYVAGYNYRDDGTVEVYLFCDAYTLDFVKYKPSGAFDKNAGFVELEGYYFNGWKSLEKVQVETKADSESATESAPATENESAADSETK